MLITAWFLSGLFTGVPLEKINLTLSEEKYQCAYTGNHYKAPYMVSLRPHSQTHLSDDQNNWTRRQAVSLHGPASSHMRNGFAPAMHDSVMQCCQHRRITINWSFRIDEATRQECENGRHLKMVPAIFSVAAIWFVCILLDRLYGWLSLQLALIHEAGLGVPRNCSKAARYMRVVLAEHSDWSATIQAAVKAHDQGAPLSCA
jgi:hypothetical protein